MEEIEIMPLPEQKVFFVIKLDKIIEKRTFVDLFDMFDVFEKLCLKYPKSSINIYELLKN